MSGKLIGSPLRSAASMVSAARLRLVALSWRRARRNAALLSAMIIGNSAAERDGHRLACLADGGRGVLDERAFVLGQRVEQFLVGADVFGDDLELAVDARDHPVGCAGG